MPKKSDHQIDVVYCDSGAGWGLVNRQAAEKVLGARSKTAGEITPFYMRLRRFAEQAEIFVNLYAEQLQIAEQESQNGASQSRSKKHQKLKFFPESLGHMRMLMNICQEWRQSVLAASSLYADVMRDCGVLETLGDRPLPFHPWELKSLIHDLVTRAYEAGKLEIVHEMKRQSFPRLKFEVQKHRGRDAKRHDPAHGLSERSKMLLGYLEEFRAKASRFPTWQEVANWLHGKIDPETNKPIEVERRRPSRLEKENLAEFNIVWEPSYLMNWKQFCNTLTRLRKRLAEKM